MRVWGHFITDSMRMLWFLNTELYREKYSDCKIIYLYGSGYGNKFELDDNHKRLLEILNADYSKLEAVTELTQYDEVILPDESFFMTDEGFRLFTSEYVRTIDLVREYAFAKFRPATPCKLYYSYSGYAKNKTFGEDKLEEYFASKGYEIIHPENLTLDEQLDKLADCTHFASTIGSCSYNMLFLRDNSEVVLIPRLGSVLTTIGYYLGAVNQVHNLKITNVDSSFSIFAKGQSAGPFLYFISSNLRKYFHDEDTESIIDAHDFWRYVRSAFGLRFGRSFGKTADADNPEVYRYYASVAAEYFSKLIKQSWPHRLRQFLKRLLRR